MKLADRMIDRSTVSLVGGFTLVDLLAIFLHWLNEHGILDSRFFRLARDRGFSEIIQYAKFGVILLLLVVWKKARPSKLISAWVLLFTVMLLDDAIGIHEAVSGWILSVVDIPTPAGIRAKDVAEGLVFAALEGGTCLYVAYRYLQAPAELRSYSRWLVVAMAPLVLCGLILDIVPVGDAEQLGEMASMSALLAFVHWRHRRRIAAAGGDAPSGPT